MAQTNFQTSGPKGSVDFAVIGEAFEIVKNNWMPYAVFSLIGIIASYAVSMIISLPFSLAQATAPTATTPEAAMAQAFASLPISLASNIVGAAVQAFLYAGIAAMALKTIRGERPELNDAFSVFNMAGPIALAGILYGVATMLGVLACCVGALVVSGLLIPLYPILVNERLPVVDAFKKSMNLMSGSWLMAALFVIVQGLIAGLGVIACCVGMFFTVPIAFVCSTLIYRDVAGITFGPTSQTAYPREGGGSMPGYDGPTDTNPPTQG